MSDPKNILPPLVNTNLLATDPGESLERLLVEGPLHSSREIPNLINERFNRIEFPQVIYAHCEHEKCGSVLRHHKTDSEEFGLDPAIYAYITGGTTSAHVIRTVAFTCLEVARFLFAAIEIKNKEQLDKQRLSLQNKLNKMESSGLLNQLFQDALLKGESPLSRGKRDSRYGPN
jgi:hypothetical protein